MFIKMLIILFFMLIILPNLLALCPSGTIQGDNPNDCYKILAKPLSWASADESCVDYGGHLASIGDVFHNAFILNQVQEVFTNANEIWIGGNTLLVPGSWTWSDKTSFNYNNWDKGQPNSNQSTCTTFNIASGKWNSQICSNLNLPYVCKINASNETPCSKSTFQPPTCPTMPSYNPCPNGYIYHTSTTQCYRIYNGSGLTFDLAENKCNQDGGHLASIHSQEENYFLTDISFNGNPYATAWIGMHYVNNAYQWIDGTAVNYTNWGGKVDTYRFTCGYIDSGYMTDGSGDWFGYWNNYGGCTNTQITYIICKLNPNKF